MKRHIPVLLFVLLSILLLGEMACDKSSLPKPSKSNDPTNISKLTLSVDTLGNYGATTNLTDSFKLFSKSNWRITSKANWISIGPDSGFGEKVVKIRVLSNSNSTRYAIVKAVDSKSFADSLIVIQSGTGIIQLSFSAEKFSDIPSSGNQTKAVEVQSNSGWTLLNSSDWIIGNVMSGIGSKIVDFTIKPNTGPIRRAVVKALSKGVVYDSLVFTQLAGVTLSPILKISDIFLLIGKDANSKNTFSITSNTNWTVASNSAWLKPSQTSGVSSATITNTASANLGEAREAILTIKDGTQKIIEAIHVVQAGSNQISSLFEKETINSTDTGRINVASIPIIRQTYNYRYNNISCRNNNGYVFFAGQEIPTTFDNYFDGSFFMGNKVVWLGTDLNKTTHGIFTAHNKNLSLCYNYIEGCPYGIITKSSGMTHTFGSVSYNVLVNSKRSITVKGINGAKIYNNTIYSLLSKDIARALIAIYANNDAVNPGFPSTNCKVYNNVFYTKSQIVNIQIDKLSLPGFECDYNIYYCENGEPLFSCDGKGYTFAQWQALGYDIHSKVINPKFIGPNNFVPQSPLNYGKDLGFEFQYGLSTDNVWPMTNSSYIKQGSTWQVGAYVVK